MLFIHVYAPSMRPAGEEKYEAGSESNLHLAVNKRIFIKKTILLYTS
jgi:hypothetical protein